MGQIQSVGDVLGLLRRHVMLILVVSFLGSAFSVWWVLNQPRLYEATAVAQIEAATVADAEGSPLAGTSADQRLRLLEQQLMARDNLVEVIERFGLYAETELSRSRKVAQLRESVRITQITDPNVPPGMTRIPTGMRIAVTHNDAEAAADVANHFLSQLVERNRERRSTAALRNLEFFESEAQRIEAEMAALEEQIADFREENARYLGEGISAQRDELGTLRSTLLEIEQRIIELESSRTRQRAEVIERQRALLEEQQALIEARIAQIEEAIASSPEVERQFGVLNRQLEQLREQYDIVTRRATEAEMGQLLESQQRTERIEVLENALVPENPVSGSRTKRAALGGGMSLVLGLAIAFLIEMLNPVIRTRAQLEQALNVKAVVAIPRLETPRQHRRRWVLLLSVLLALGAVLVLGWQVIRDAVEAVLGALQRRRTQA
ncbi:GumC family protein [Aquicoccus sp.]|uniref:GumC family protein n=1 Tax=Aquicoccus sp. TaxID=2055851 RepID=UPI003566FCCF